MESEEVVIDIDLATKHDRSVMITQDEYKKFLMWDSKLAKMPNGVVCLTAIESEESVETQENTQALLKIYDEEVKTNSSNTVDSIIFLEQEILKALNKLKLSLLVFNMDFINKNSNVIHKEYRLLNIFGALEILRVEDFTVFSFYSNPREYYRILLFLHRSLT